MDDEEKPKEDKQKAEKIKELLDTSSSDDEKTKPADPIKLATKKEDDNKKIEMYNYQIQT